MQAGTANPVSVAVSSVTAALGMRGGFWWNVGTNAEGGVVRAEANNLIYGGHDSVLLGRLQSGAIAGVGYGLGYTVSGVIFSAMRPNVSSPDEWVLLSGTPSIYGWNGGSGAVLFNKSPWPILFGNGMASSASELVGKDIDSIPKKGEGK